MDVVLYTREEFALHHGAGMAQRVAGFYSAGAIRVNDSAEINGQNTATLVHEYVHAAVDELVSGRSSAVPLWLNEGLAEYVEWRFQGHDQPPKLVDNALRAAALKGQLPSLSELTRGPPLAGQPNAGLRYALSASAVRLLLQEGGVDNLLGLLTELGEGAELEAAFRPRYGKGVERFEQALRDELSRR